MTNLNPFTLLDSILADYASARARRTIHTVLLLVAAVVTIYFAVEGEWKEFAIALGAALYTGANKANTPGEPTITEVADAVTDAGLAVEVSLTDPAVSDVTYVDGEAYEPGDDVADYDYGSGVYADASEPDTTGLPIDAPHGGTGESE